MKKTVKKQILRYGEWKNPNARNGVLSITKDYVSQLIENFKHTPFVPVLRGHVENSEAEANPNLIVAKNIKDLEADNEGLNAVFDVDEGELDKYNDVSASIDESYENHETGNVIGATLKHIALVVDPYIKGLGNFIPLKDRVNYLINLSEIIMAKEKCKPTTELAEEAAEVKEETKVPAETEVVTEVEKVEEKAEEATPEKVETESNEAEVKEETPAEAPTEEKTEEKPEAEAEVKTEEKPVEEEVKTETVDSSELQKTILELQEQIKARDVEIANAKANAKYIELRDAGKATPAMEDSIKSLYQSSSTIVNLADGSKKSTGELLDALFEKMPKLIEFGEVGVNTEAIDENAQPYKVELMEQWKKQNPQMTSEQLEARYQKSAAYIKEAAKKV